MNRALTTMLWLGTLAAQAPAPPAAGAPKLDVALWPGSGAGSNSGTWLVSQPLRLLVTIRHPLAGEAVAAPPFVLDPVGGYGAAVTLQVLDPDGKPAAWPVERTWTPAPGLPNEADHVPPQPSLELHLRGKAQVMFVLATPPVDLRGGTHRIVARLEATTGAWRGAVQTTPFELEVAPAIVCELEPPRGDAVRGSPLLLSATVRRVEPDQRGLWRSPDELAARPALPQRWTLERLGADAAGESTTVLAAFVASEASEPDEVWALQVVVPAEATNALAVGPCRLRLRGDPAVTSAAVEFSVVEPPAHRTPAQAAWQCEARLHEALARLHALGAGAHDDRGRPTPAARALAQQAMAEVALARQHAPDDERLLGIAAALADRLGEAAAGAVRDEVVAVAAQRGEPAAPAWLLGDDAVPFAGGTTPAPTSPAGEPPPAAAPAAPPAPTQSPPAAPAANRPEPTDPQAPAALRHAGPVPAGDCKQQDAAFGADPLGQWAASATASSQYSPTSYSAQAATGAPDVEKHGDDARAWAPSAADRGEETLTLRFPRPVRAAGVRIRQSFHPGRIQRVVVAGADGTRAVFEGPDRTSYGKDTIGWLVLAFPPTTFAVDRVQVVLDTKSGPGYEEIDAVQLVESDGRGR